MGEFVPLTERAQSAENGNPIKTRADKDGVYTTPIIEFSSCKNTSRYFTSTGKSYYNLNGTEMLSVDPLNKQSTAMFGFGNTLPIAVAQNTPVKSMLSLNFEVEEGSTLKGQRLRNETISGTAQVLPDEHAHSGKKVLSVQPNGMPNASIEWDFNQTTNGKVEEFILGPGKYVFSAWVKADQPVEVSISEGGNPVATSVTQTNSNSIEGWKRVEFTFAIASATGTVKMNSLSGFKVDDLRIFPYNGNMKAFVYDPVSLKLVATLDENNYATYYIYDEEHQLVQVKRETEKGVITVKASKSNIGQ